MVDILGKWETRMVTMAMVTLDKGNTEIMATMATMATMGIIKGINSLIAAATMMTGTGAAMAEVVAGIDKIVIMINPPYSVFQN